MSVWTQISDYISDLASDAFTSVIEAVRTVFEGDPETRRQVGFSVAMIALSAKMAKADGVVTVDEVRAFQQIFEIPEPEFDNVSRLYNLARQDVAGFQSYAQKVRNLFPNDAAILTDVMDGLFHIAKADGLFHENEMALMDETARIFGIQDRDYARIRARHMESEDGDPYLVLGADPHWDVEALKKHYRKMVSENHPDQMISRGVPEEFIAISNERMARINKAWERIALERGL